MYMGKTESGTPFFFIRFGAHPFFHIPGALWGGLSQQAAALPYLRGALPMTAACSGRQER